MKFKLEKIFEIADSYENKIQIDSKVYDRSKLLQVIADNLENVIGSIELDDEILEKSAFSDFEKDNFIPVSSADISSEEIKRLFATGISGWISSQANSVSQFEKKFADLNGSKFCVACSNGTVAIQLALKALGIGGGDEVIVPALTFAATANAVVHCGAKPVFVDIDRGDWNIDCLEVQKAITKNTKAVICVHLFGKPANVRELRKICDEHDLFLIEDCAEAHFARVGEDYVGNFGDISTFSFFSNKIISTGEGGCCLTNDRKLENKMKILRDHGMNKTKKYWHDEVGFNFRMTAMQSSIGLGQLARLDEIYSWRLKLENNYNKIFSTNTKLTFQRQDYDTKSVCWLYSFLLPSPSSRNNVIELGKNKSIDIRPFFNSLPDMPAFENFSCGKDFPISREIASRGVNLPTQRYVSSSEISRIHDLIFEALR